VLNKEGPSTRYLFLTFIVVASCKNPASTTQSSVKIANGIQTDTVKYPSVVLVKTDSPTNETCSGTFIGSGVVLTAAHCLAAKQTNGGTPIDDPRVIESGGKRCHNKSYKCLFSKVDWQGKHGNQWLRYSHNKYRAECLMFKHPIQLPFIRKKELIAHHNLYLIV
jgi:hypothetical protein